MSQPLNGPGDTPPGDPTTPLPPVTGAGAAPAPPGTPGSAEPVEPPTVAYSAPAAPGQPVEPPTVAYPPVTAPGQPPVAYPAPGGYAQPGGGYPVPAAGYPGQPGPGLPSPYQAPVPGAPTSAVPASGVPVSGGPQPYSGVPYSGAPFGQPMSGPPGPGLPYAAPPVAGGGRRRTVLVLSIVVALLFSVGAVTTGLFVTKSNELSRTERDLGGKLRERDTTITGNQQQIEQLKRDVQAANDRIKAVEQDLTGTKNDRDEQARQKAVIAKCLDLFSKAMTATSEAAFRKALEEADKVCEEADGYL